MSLSHPFQRPEGVRVTYRRMKFDFEQGFDRYWLGGSAFRSLFWTQLSTAFEPGERYFIDSARALKGKVDDPALLEEIAEFCRQEGHHTAQHLKFDAINQAMGVDVLACRRRYARVLDWARKQSDASEMLAVTCALEHFTAGLADLFLHNEAISEGGDPRVLALWAWHAAEEAEHRATCYDLYRAIGGGYGERVGSLIAAWFLIVSIALFNTTLLLHKDGQLFTRDSLRGLAYLFGRRGVLSGLVPAFVHYFAPRFHPWKGASGEDIARWQAANARYITNLDQIEQRAVSAQARLSA
jgi:uncharacterized protein